MTTDRDEQPTAVARAFFSTGNSQAISQQMLDVVKAFSSPAISQQMLDVTKAFSSPAISQQMLDVVKAFSSPAISQQMLDVTRGFSSAAISQQMLDVTKAFSRPALARAVQSQLSQMSLVLSDPSITASLRTQVSASLADAAPGEGSKDGSTVALASRFADFVFLVVLTHLVGLYLAEANRTGESLLEANRIGLTAVVCWAVSIAWHARLVVLRASAKLDDT